MDFKIGDRVIAINPYDGEDIEGHIGTILGLPQGDEDDTIYPVQFDDWDNGHACGGRGSEGYCWWVDSCCLELAKETNPSFTPSGNPIIDRSRKLWYKSKYGKKHLTLVQTT